MTYKLIKNPITSEVDQVNYTDSTNRGKIIPFDPDNTDYQDNQIYGLVQEYW